MITDTMQRRPKKPLAFTLIELLVVIAVVAVLMGLLLPALSRAREQGKRVTCFHNAKTLLMGWIMYCDEYQGKMPSAEASDLASTDSNAVWVRKPPGLTPVDTALEDQIESIKQGVLYKYVGDVKVYRCPVAKREEMRTYSCSHAMNGRSIEGGTVLTSRYRIKRQAERIVFLDDFGDNWDAAWAVPWSRPAWWNPIPARHGNGTVVSFADGHVTWWAWKDACTIELMAKRDWGYHKLDVVHEGNPDLERVQKAIWGSPLGYVP